MRVRVLVSGRVQGVGFRYHTRRQALERGIAGWVRNESDGRVSAEFQGPKANVDSMLEWCQHGPSTASVGSVEKDLCEEVDGESGFRVRS